MHRPKSKFKSKTNPVPNEKQNNFTAHLIKELKGRFDGASVYKRRTFDSSHRNQSVLRVSGAAGTASRDKRGASEAKNGAGPATRKSSSLRGPRARALHSPHAVTEEGKTRRAQKITSIRERAADVAKNTGLPRRDGRLRVILASDDILGHCWDTGGRFRGRRIVFSSTFRTKQQQHGPLGSLALVTNERNERLPLLLCPARSGAAAAAVEREKRETRGRGQEQEPS
jgi:hypothetical protein